MLDFIIRYWVQEAFTLFLAGLGFIIKKYFADKKKEEQRHAEQVTQEIKTLIKENNKVLDEELTNIHGEIFDVNTKIQSLQSGVLDLQGPVFKNHCRELLKDNKKISLEDMEEINKEHEVYHGLGGNHEGDFLYEAVIKKFNGQLD